MATIGELTDFGVADLIDLITARGRSGRLTIKAAGDEVALYFDAGSLVYVTSSDITLRLGRMLVRQGLIDTPQLLEALHIQSETEPKRPLGAILLERGWLMEADLLRCLEDQSIEMLSRTITEEPGLFVFDRDVRAPKRTEAEPLDAGALLQYAKERTDALRKLREQLPPASTPLFLVAQALDEPALLDDLSTPETMVVSVLRSGPKSVAELSQQLALDELSLSVAVIGLIARGTVVVSATTALSSARLDPVLVG